MYSVWLYFDLRYFACVFFAALQFSPFHTWPDCTFQVSGGWTLSCSWNQEAFHDQLAPLQTPNRGPDPSLTVRRQHFWSASCQGPLWNHAASNLRKFSAAAASADKKEARAAAAGKERPQILQERPEWPWRGRGQAAVPSREAPDSQASSKPCPLNISRRESEAEQNSLPSIQSLPLPRNLCILAQPSLALLGIASRCCPPFWLDTFPEAERSTATV